MITLVRATELIGRPVVTLAGDDIAQIKDVVFAAPGGHLIGFTLAGRGRFAGPLDRALPWDRVHGAGRDAIIVSDGELPTRDELVSRADLRNRDVLGDAVLTDAGTALGTVTDVVVELGVAPQVAGYQIRTGEALPPAGRTVLIPLPEAMSVSGEAVVVAATVAQHATEDLAALGATISSYRARTGESR
ncbi:PRC-barrel domain-containing protein [Catenuloplanes atrovinosus]|uniref:Uncharacterized protein YrrD n=1 Tax=Catenuloplanes atrovinosus TaxID=137266 RepID=A0AAE3YMG3_9ACTN|nr:PRC-barrel domain-containing protein [Catenuloplanes atrovinosus]MDR7276458.1 uncharacterized protein YrrD [Catenuloplanes atrovinosus]